MRIRQVLSRRRLSRRRRRTLVADPGRIVPEGHGAGLALDGLLPRVYPDVRDQM